METINKQKRVFTNEHKQRLKQSARNRWKKYRDAKTIKIIVIDEQKNTKTKNSFFQKLKNWIKNTLKKSIN